MSRFETNHPLQQTFTRIRQLSPYLGARLGQSSETDWVTPADLFAPQSAALAALIDAAHQRLRTQAATLTGSALIQEYQWPLISTGIACFLTDRRVPDLRPENLHLRFPPEEEEAEEVEQPDRIAFTSGRFAALPDDPAASHPDAYLVPDLDALRAELRSGLEAHLAWAIARISRAVGCKEKGLWPFVADRCAMTLSWLMQEGEGQSCLTCISREAAGLVQVADSPLYHKKLSFFELTYQEQTRVYPDRATCCYWYKTEGGDYCSTCPHRTKEDRNARLLAYMAEEYHK
jgi:hypothetical protein